MTAQRNQWEEVAGRQLEFDVIERERFGLRWWGGSYTTMNWLTVGPMRVDEQPNGKTVGVLVTVFGRVFGVSKREWWT